MTDPFATDLSTVSNAELGGMILLTGILLRHEQDDQLVKRLKEMREEAQKRPGIRFVSSEEILAQL